MIPIFTNLIDTYIENKVGISEDFLSLQLSAQLKKKLLSLFANNQLYSARVGDSDHVQLDKKIRSDIIYWLDRKHNNHIENNFLDLIDQFVLYLNSTCYAGITGYEFHYTLYQKGSFYKKHLDQFINNKGREFSMIIYLNTDWKKEDGGELCIDFGESTQHIAPTNGKCVFFKSSELLHQVLLTNQPRLSITRWLKTN